MAENAGRYRDRQTRLINIELDPVSSLLMVQQGLKSEMAKLGRGSAIWHPKAGIPRLTAWLNHVFENEDLWPDSLKEYVKAKGWDLPGGLSSDKASEWMEYEFNRVHKGKKNVLPITISVSWVSRYLRGQSNPATTLNFSHLMVLVKTGFLRRPDKKPVDIDWLFAVLTLEIDPISEYKRLEGIPPDSERRRLAGYISAKQLNPYDEESIDQFVAQIDVRGDVVELMKNMLLRDEEPIAGDAFFVTRMSQLAHVYSLCDPSFDQTQFNLTAAHQDEAALR